MQSDAARGSEGGAVTVGVEMPAQILVHEDGGRVAVVRGEGRQGARDHSSTLDRINDSPKKLIDFLHQAWFKVNTARRSRNPTWHGHPGRAHGRDARATKFARPAKILGNSST